MTLNSDTIKEVSVKKRISVGDIQIGVQERAAINEVLDAGRISEWKKVSEFERLFADYINTKHCVAVNSGTSALIVGLSALIYDSRFPKIKKGSKVITTFRKNMSDIGRFNPMSLIFFLNFFLSSALEIAFEFAPISSILYFLSNPIFSALIAKFKRYWANSKEEILFRNFWREDLSDASVVICFLLERTMKDFEKKIWPKLKKGARVISNDFRLEKVEPDESDGMVYLYIKK